MRDLTVHVASAVKGGARTYASEANARKAIDRATEGHGFENAWFVIFPTGDRFVPVTMVAADRFNHGIALAQKGFPVIVL